MLCSRSSLFSLFLSPSCKNWIESRAYETTHPMQCYAILFHAEQFGLLYEHPNIIEPRKPGHEAGAGNIFEPGHFVDFDLVFAKGLPFYASFFPDNKHLSPKFVMSLRESVVRARVEQLGLLLFFSSPQVFFFR